MCQLGLRFSKCQRDLEPTDTWRSQKRGVFESSVIRLRLCIKMLNWDLMYNVIIIFNRVNC